MASVYLSTPFTPQHFHLCEPLIHQHTRRPCPTQRNLSLWVRGQTRSTFYPTSILFHEFTFLLRFLSSYTFHVVYATRLKDSKKHTRLCISFTPNRPLLVSSNLDSHINPPNTPPPALPTFPRRWITIWILTRGDPPNLITYPPQATRTRSRRWMGGSRA